MASTSDPAAVLDSMGSDEPSDLAAPLIDLATAASQVRGGEPYVVTNLWPACEQQLDEDDEDFEQLTHSSVVTPSMLLDAEATQDSLLDALSRLREERARNERLQLQVEVAHALASLPNSGLPDRAATTIACGCRTRLCLLYTSPSPRDS